MCIKNKIEEINKELLEFIRLNLLEIPAIFSYEDYFPDFIEENFNNYLKNVKALYEKNYLTSDQLTIIENIIKSFMEAINQYFKGQINSCINSLFDLEIQSILDDKEKGAIYCNNSIIKINEIYGNNTINFAFDQNKIKKM